MYAPVVVLGAFTTLGDAAKSHVLLMLLEALISSNVAYLRAHPEAPPLYRSGVRYTDDPRDEWQDIPATLAKGGGDCEDLASWRVAELRVRAREHALPRVTAQRRGASTLFHVTVLHPSGRVEDPSRRLGMR